MRLKEVLQLVALSSFMTNSIASDLTSFDIHALNTGQIINETATFDESSPLEKGITQYINNFEEKKNFQPVNNTKVSNAMNSIEINLPPDNLTCYNLNNNVAYTINLATNSYICADFSHTDETKGFSIDAFQSNSANLKVSAYLESTNGYLAIGSSNSGSTSAALLRTLSNFPASTIRVVTHYDPLNSSLQQYKLAFRTFSVDSHEPNNATSQASTNTNNHIEPIETSYQVSASLSHEGDIDVFSYNLDSNDKTRFVTLRIPSSHITKFGVAAYLNDDNTQLQTSYEFRHNLWNEPTYETITFKVKLDNKVLFNTDKLIIKIIPQGTQMFTDIPYHMNVSNVNGSQVSGLTGSYRVSSGGLIYFKLSNSPSSQLLEIEYDYTNNGHIMTKMVTDSRGRIFYGTPIDSCSFMFSIQDLKISVYNSDINFWYFPLINKSFPNAICQ